MSMQSRPLISVPSAGWKARITKALSSRKGERELVDASSRRTYDQLLGEIEKRVIGFLLGGFEQRDRFLFIHYPELHKYIKR